MNQDQQAAKALLETQFKVLSRAEIAVCEYVIEYGCLPRPTYKKLNDPIESEANTIRQERAHLFESLKVQFSKEIASYVQR